MSEIKLDKILAPKSALSEPEDLAAPESLEPDDFYMDGPYLVFTAAYHLRRGSCCKSDCRHCPYK
jgi:hypothetical protein